MSMIHLYKVKRIISEEDEKRILELGLHIDLHPDRTEEEKARVEKAMEKIETARYNPVRIEKYTIMDTRGPMTYVEIGRPPSKSTTWMSVPATKENREIVRKIEDILLQV